MNQVSNATASGETDEKLITPKRICSLGLWNVLSLNSPGKSKLLVNELIRFGVNIAVMVINSSDNEAAYKLYFSGGSTHHNSVALAVNQWYTSYVRYFSPISDRLAFLVLEGTMRVTIIVAYAPTNCCYPHTERERVYYCQ